MSSLPSVDARESQGALFQPSAPVNQHFGDQNINLVLPGMPSPVNLRDLVQLLQGYQPQPAPRMKDLFELIVDPDSVLPALFRTDTGRGLTPYQVAYARGREGTPDVQAEMGKALLRAGGHLLVRGRSGIGKTREVAEVARHWCAQGWTVCIAKSEGDEDDPDARLNALASFPVELSDARLLFIFDNLHRRAGKLSDKQVAYAERLDALLQYLKDNIAPNNLRVIAVIPSEPQYQKLVNMDGGRAPWNRFGVYDLPEFSEAGLVQILRALAAQAGVAVVDADIDDMIANSDRRPRTLVTNIRLAQEQDQPLGKSIWRPTDGQTWQDSFMLAQNNYPASGEVYQSLHLLREAGLPTRRAYVAQLSSGAAAAVNQAIDGLIFMGLLGLRQDLLTLYSEEQLVDSLRDAGTPLLDIAEQWDRLIEAVKGIEQRPPRWTDDLSALAARLLQADQYGRADDVLSLVIAAGSDSAQVYMMRGAARFMRPDLIGGEADLTAAFERGQDDATAYAMRGVIRTLRGEFAGTIADMSAAIERGSNDAVVYSLRGWALLNEGQPEKAEVDLSAAIERDPANSMLYWSRSVVRQRLGDDRGLDADLTAALEHGLDLRWVDVLPSMEHGDWSPLRELQEQPAQSDGHGEAFVYLMRGVTRFRLGDFAGAESDLTLGLDGNGLDILARFDAMLRQTNLGLFDKVKQDWAGVEPQLKSQKGEIYFMRGVARYNLGRYGDAQQDFEAALAAGRDNLVTRLTLSAVRSAPTLPAPGEREDGELCFAHGVAQYSLRRFAEAESDFDAALAKGKTDASAHAMRAALLFDMGRPAEAEGDLNAALAGEPADAIIYAQRGALYMMLNRAADTERDLSSAIDRGKQDASIYYLRGAARLNLGKFADADSDLDVAIARGMDDADSYMQRGFARYNLQRYADAEDDCDAAMARGRDDVVAYSMRGEARLLQGKAADAAADLEAALARSQEAVFAYRMRGALAFDLGRYPEAEQDMDAAIRLGPEDAFVYFVRGVARFQQAKLAEADSDLSEAIRRGRDDAAVYTLRVVARLGSGEFAGAEQDADAAMARGASDPAIFQGRGRARGRQGKYREAEDDFDAAIRGGMDDADIYLDRGLARERQDKHAEAESDFSAAIERGMDSDSIHYLRGLARYRQEHWGDALSDFDAAISRGWDDAETYAMRSAAHSSLGHSAEAESDLSAALARGWEQPTDPAQASGE